MGNGNAKLLSGSVLIGTGLIGTLLNEWASHFFFAAYHLARAQALQGAGSFSAPARYTDPAAVTASPITAGLLWVAVALGAVFVIWGAVEERG